MNPLSTTRLVCLLLAYSFILCYISSQKPDITNLNSPLITASMILRTENVVALSQNMEPIPDTWHYV
jgi:hypothetical protein